MEKSNEVMTSGVFKVGDKVKVYTLNQIEEAWIKSGWGHNNGAWGIFKGHLTKAELEYQQYLALKAKFEG